MKYCVTIELESKAEAHEIIERLPTERPGLRNKGSISVSRLLVTVLYNPINRLYNIYTYAGA